MRILGLDPGSRFTGYALIDRRGSHLAPVAYGRFRLTQRELAPRLAYLATELEELIRYHEPEAAALESLYHGVNPRSAIVLAQARGALLATLGRAGLPVAEYSPAEIKTAVTGYGRAEKGQVGRMVAVVLGLGGEKLTADASDALAVALCYAQRLRFDRLQGRGAASDRS